MQTTRFLDHPVQEGQVRETSFEMARSSRATEWIFGRNSRHQTSQARDPVYGIVAVGKIIPIRRTVLARIFNPVTLISCILS